VERNPGRFISKYLTITILLCAVILAAPSFFNLEFEVINNASDPVSVIAVWQNNEKHLGNIQPS